jgi:DNA-binding transcriptional LysR family regulator
MVDPHRLLILREVARHGSFSGAARALHLTQPAVSRHVAKLERESGTLLLVRTSRGVRPTEAGRVVLEHADGLLASLAAAERALEAVRGLDRGTVRVASFPSAAAAIVLPALADFRSRHPRVEVAFVDASSIVGLDAVRAGDVDLALAFQGPEEPLPADGLELVHLLTDPLLIALPPTHRFAGRRTLRLAELKDESWIVGTSSELTLRACRAAGFEPRVVCESDQSSVSQGLVAAGLGVTLVTTLGLPRARQDLELVPPSPPVERELYAGMLPGSPRPPANAALLEFVVAHARKAALAAARRQAR